jgi:hypothetical protein
VTFSITEFKNNKWSKPGEYGMAIELMGSMMGSLHCPLTRRKDNFSTVKEGCLGGC